MTKVRIQDEEERDKNYEINILDQTRIHYKQQDDAFKIAAYHMSDGNLESIGKINKDQNIIIDIIKNPQKLKEMMMSDYKFKDKLDS